MSGVKIIDTTSTEWFQVDQIDSVGNNLSKGEGLAAPESAAWSAARSEPRRAWHHFRIADPDVDL